MSFATDCLIQLERLGTAYALPPVRAFHLPPDPPPGQARGEFCALELQDGSLGLSYVLLGDTLASLRMGGGGLGGTDALGLARLFAHGQGAQRALGLAAVNALSRWFFDRAGYRPPVSADSLGALNPQPGDHIGMIGLFTPLLPRVLASGAALTVVELKAHLAAQHEGWRVTLDPEELHRCNKVLGTGTLLLNDTLDRMLGCCSSAQWLALIGPSLGCLPDGLLARGVTLIGGNWVLDGPAYVDALRSGEQRRGLAQKVAVTAADYPGFEALLTRL